MDWSNLSWMVIGQYCHDICHVILRLSFSLGGEHGADPPPILRPRRCTLNTCCSLIKIQPYAHLTIYRLGKSTSIVAQLLCDTLVDGSPIFKQTGEVLTLMDTAGNDCKSRSDSIMSVMETLRDNETIEFLSGWRDELYPISEGFYDTPVLFVERAATPLLGTQDYGVHINGLVRDDDTGDLKMWMARRSQTKSKYPGMLDHIVAGGQPAGMTLIDNVVKECEEEAGIPASLTRRLAKPTGAISYETFERGGKNIDGVISRALMFNFDIELPFDFQPKVVDGEVEEFFKCSIDEVKAMMDPGFDDPIKPNCYIVIIDYLMREGQIDPDTKGYLDIVRLLQSGYCG